MPLGYLTKYSSVFATQNPMDVNTHNELNFSFLSYSIAATINNINVSNPISDSIISQINFFN